MNGIVVSLFTCEASGHFLTFPERGVERHFSDIPGGCTAAAIHLLHLHPLKKNIRLLLYSNPFYNDNIHKNKVQDIR